MAKESENIERKLSSFVLNQPRKARFIMWDLMKKQKDYKFAKHAVRKLHRPYGITPAQKQYQRVEADDCGILKDKT